MTIPKKIRTYLERSKVRYEVVPHKTVFTAYDLGQTLKTKLEGVAKTLLVKADATYHLVVLRASDRLDLKKLQRLLAAKKVKIAREQDMARELKVRPGALTPFAGVHKLGLVVDKALTRAKQALFGSGSFEHSIRMKVADWLKLEQPKTGSFSTSSGLKLQVKPTRPAQKR